ncbi:MAG: anthranilate synthase component I family protein [Candidatus Omnitrophica bacterium]|nr:anthranilate synthase component I family protein [Candidatus Omnitrophota bacterium]
MPSAWCLAVDAPLPLAGIVEAARASSQSVVWLDSARRHPATGRYSIAGWDPWLTLTASGRAAVLTTSTSTTTQAGNPLDLLQAVLARYPGPRHEALPPVGCGWLGAFGYELNRWIERLPPPPSPALDTPDLLLFGMRQLIVVDHAAAKSWLVIMADPHQPAARAMREARERLDALTALTRSSAAEPAAVLADVQAAASVDPTMPQGQFEALVRRVQEYIRDGEIFQANLSQRFEAAWPGSAWSLYLALRQVNPSPFACFLQTPSVSLVSCSPERLVAVRGGQASARPIAGTRPRGASAEEDVVNSLELILSDKERAEHIMLVDLARNDLGRVCRFGSVGVDELMVLEDYSHVIHIVSNVLGRVRAGVGAVEVLRAVFPGGTITGCPKVRCMEILQELEPVARGFYTGSAGWLGFDGSLDLNILIRTMVMQGSRVSFHVGAGIVADSQPDREYHETLAKGAALLHALRGSGAIMASDAGGR